MNIAVPNPSQQFILSKKLISWFLTNVVCVEKKKKCYKTNYVGTLFCGIFFHRNLFSWKVSKKKKKKKKKKFWEFIAEGVIWAELIFTSSALHQQKHRNLILQKFILLKCTSLQEKNRFYMKENNFQEKPFGCFYLCRCIWTDQKKQLPQSST